MRVSDDVHDIETGRAVRVAGPTPRSRRNEGNEPVELWAISRVRAESDAVKIDDFWDPSPDAARERPPA